MNKWDFPVQAKLKFINDVIKPWGALSDLLVQRFAFQPDLSDVTILVAAVATAIKHQVDILALERASTTRKLQPEVNAESEAARLMSDVSDVAKHVKLNDPARQNSIYVAAMFEVNEAGQFRFMRNGVFVEHASLGCRDFIRSSLSAIKYWSRKRGLNLSFSCSIRQAHPEFFPTAFLYYDPRFCVNFDSTQIRFFRRNDTGDLVPYDPPNVDFEILYA